MLILYKIANSKPPYRNRGRNVINVVTMPENIIDQRPRLAYDTYDKRGLLIVPV